MNNPTDSDSNNQDSQQQAEESHRALFKKIYKLISPTFIYVFGTMGCAAILAGLDGKMKAFWVCGCLSLLFLCLFFFEIVRIHKFSPKHLKHKKIYSSVLVFAMIVLLTFGSFRLFSNESQSPNIDPEKSQNPVHHSDSLSILGGTKPFSDTVTLAKIPPYPQVVKPKQTRTTSSKKDTTLIINAPNNKGGISINQQGGFTGNIENLTIESESIRGIPLNKVDWFLKQLAPYSGHRISFVAIMGDREATDLAENLNALFDSAGWKTKDVGQGLFEGNCRGMALRTKDKSSPAAQCLLSTFDQLGLHLIFIQTPTQPEFEIYVCKKP